MDQEGRTFDGIHDNTDDEELHDNSDEDESDEFENDDHDHDNSDGSNLDNGGIRKTVGKNKSVVVDTGSESGVPMMIVKDSNHLNRSLYSIYGNNMNSTSKSSGRFSSDNNNNTNLGNSASSTSVPVPGPASERIIVDGHDKVWIRYATIPIAYTMFKKNSSVLRYRKLQNQQMLKTFPFPLHRHLP